MSPLPALTAWSTSEGSLHHVQGLDPVTLFAAPVPLGIGVAGLSGPA